MPVPVQIPAKASTANGITVVFPYDFLVLEAADLLVSGTFAGVTTTYVLDVDYTVSGVGVPGGGNVTFISGAPINGTVVLRKRNMAFKRDTDYQANGDLIADEVNADIDNLAMQLQQVAEANARAITLPPHLVGQAGQLPTPEPGKPLVWDIDGLRIVNGDDDVSGDLLLRGHLADTGVSKGAELVGFLQTGTDSVPRDIQSKSRERLSVLDKIPVSEHAAIRAKTSALDVAGYINQALAEASADGRDVFVPAGKYKLSSGLFIDESGDTDDYHPRAALIGEGVSNTIFEFATGDMVGLTIQGGTGSGTHTNLRTGGFSLQKTDRLGTALLMDNCAYAAVRDLFASGWQYGHKATDCLTGLYERCTFRNNDYGFQGTYVNGSFPNAISFLSCEFGINKYAAAQLIGAGSVTFYGGAIEGNGWVGGGVGYGIYIEDAGAESGVGLAVHGTYFEANEGVADIWIKNTAAITRHCAHSLLATTFNRISNLSYVTNNVRIENLSPSNVTLHVGAGCGFKRFGSYVADVSRQYINKINSSSGSVRVSTAGGANMYMDAVEHAELSGIADTDSCLPIALGRWTVAAGVVTTVMAKNVSGVVRNGAGDFTVTLQEGAATASPVSFVNAGTADMRTHCRALTATTIQVYTRDSAGALADPAGFGLLVHALR